MASLAHRLGTLATLAMAAVACDRGPAPDPVAGFLVRDSAGIPIVENHTPESGPGEFWTVGSEPDFVIGGYDGTLGAADDSSHLVWGILDAVPLSDGRVAMASFPRREVLVFERSGTLSATIGRQGHGPGEFAIGPEHLQVLPGDTIVVWDAGFGRISYFDPSGRLLRERQIDLGALIEATRTADRTPPESVAQPLPDGSFLVQMYPSDWQTPDHGVIYRQPVHYARIDSDNSVFSFGWWAGREHLSGPPSVPGLLPSAATSLVAAGGNPLFVYTTNGDDYEIRQFSDSGMLQRVVRRAAPPSRPVTRGDVEQIRKGNEAFTPHFDWSAWERIMADLPRRERPAIGALTVDSAGYLWVADRGTSREGGWSVFNPEGRWIGTTRLPHGAILWIGSDLIIMSSVDAELGIETIAGHRLNRTK